MLRSDEEGIHEIVKWENRISCYCKQLTNQKDLWHKCKKKTVNDVSTKAESFSNIVKSYKWIREHTKVHDILKQQNEIQNGGQDTGRWTITSGAQSGIPTTVRNVGTIGI